MFISVIIPTFNGEQKIVNLLKCLESQIDVEYEVIVIIDGSTDNTYNIIKKWENLINNFTIINQINGGRSKSRNAGSKIAKGELLVFFDDDMRIESNTLKNHLMHHLLYKDTLCVGTTFEDFNKSSTDFQIYRGKLSRLWCKKFMDNPLIDKENPYSSAANLSLSSKIFKQFNGFDEQLTDAEDYDLAVRMTIGSVEIYFKHNIIGWHDDFVTMNTYIKRLMQYKVSHAQLLLLKPELYSKRFTSFQEVKFPLYKRIVFFLFKFNFWINIVDMDVLKYFIHSSIRYKLYDLILTAQTH